MQSISSNLDNYIIETLMPGVSDYHFMSDRPIVIRRYGNLIRQDYTITKNSILEFQKKYGTNSQEFGATLMSDKGIHRIRCNFYTVYSAEKILPAVSIRILPMTIPSMQELHLPEIIKTIASEKSGLVIIAGITGSGKSTTQASILDYINETQDKHILTLENPVEYLYTDKRSAIFQREIPTCVESFAKGITDAVREDIDVACVGEMRDLVTMETTINLAETGHLILASLHAENCVEAVNRVINSFEPSIQHSIRYTLASVLKYVIHQDLVQTIDGKLAPLIEVMHVTDSIRAFLRENKPLENIRDSYRHDKTSYTIISSASQLISDKLVTLDSVKPLMSASDFSILSNQISSINEPQSQMANKPFSGVYK
jgi:twitching motility protein PilT